MLFLLSESRGHSHELLVTALVRAGLCEMRAQRDGNAEPDRAFTVGLFSVADALLQTTMPELLQELPFDARLRARALRRARRDRPQRDVLRLGRVGHRDRAPARLTPAHTRLTGVRDSRF
jgi:c-di-GMP-related signal transduction protein